MAGAHKPERTLGRGAAESGRREHFRPYPRQRARRSGFASPEDRKRTEEFFAKRLTDVLRLSYAESIYRDLGVLSHLGGNAHGSSRLRHRLAIDSDD